MFEQFALLHFRALESAEDSSITMEQGGASITTVPVSNLSAAHLDFETQTVHIVSPAQSSSAEEVLPSGSVPVAPGGARPADSAPTTEPDTGLKSSSVSQPVLAAPANDEGPLVGLKLSLYEDAGGTPGESIKDGSVEIGRKLLRTDYSRRPPRCAAGHWRVECRRLLGSSRPFRRSTYPFEPASLVTDNLPLYQSGSLDQDAGRIDRSGRRRAPFDGKRPTNRSGTTGAVCIAALHGSRRSRFVGDFPCDRFERRGASLKGRSTVRTMWSFKLHRSPLRNSLPHPRSR